jgi:hypothetical protein
MDIIEVDVPNIVIVVEDKDKDKDKGGVKDNIAILCLVTTPHLF